VVRSTPPKILAAHQGVRPVHEVQRGHDHDRPIQAKTKEAERKADLAPPLPSLVARMSIGKAALMIVKTGILADRRFLQIEPKSLFFLHFGAERTKILV
jgi:hypothetical protein